MEARKEDWQMPPPPSAGTVTPEILPYGGRIFILHSLRSVFFPYFRNRVSLSLAFSELSE